jgi:TPR repeat protein
MSSSGRNPRVSLLQRQADQGDSQAQFSYGSLLFRGEGVSMNKSLAAHYFKLSRDQGDARTQCLYGVLLSTAEGVPMNESLAAHYFKL